MISLVTLVVCAMVGGVLPASVLHLEPKATYVDSRIINGESVTSVNEFPHQLSLRYKSQDWHTCGASIIAENWALTAAHCVDGVSTTSLKVVGNFVDRQFEQNAFQIDLVQIIPHENYNQGVGAFPNDIALLRLGAHSTSIADKKIKVAGSSSGDFTSAGNCQISGWGLLVNGSGSQVLQKANVDVLSVSQCKSLWGNNNIQNQHICVWGTEGNGSGSCNGDSGGPLTCYESNGTPVLAGVTSWGRSGCHVGGTVTHPSVYARTSTFYNWVQTNCGNCLTA